ncbi:ribosome-binding ATPase YchF [Tanacetum coccineum]
MRTLMLHFVDAYFVNAFLMAARLLMPITAANCLLCIIALASALFVDGCFAEKNQTAGFHVALQLHINIIRGVSPMLYPSDFIQTLSYHWQQFEDPQTLFNTRVGECSDFHSKLESTQVEGNKSPVFENGPNFDTVFRLFHGQNGIVPLSEPSSSHISHNEANETVIRRFSKFIEYHARGIEKRTEKLKKSKASYPQVKSKPVIYVANVTESDLATPESNLHVKNVMELASRVQSGILSELQTEERAEFLTSLGVDESGHGNLIRVTYDLLGLRTYFTSEKKAWTIHAGMTAPQAAGVIHSNFEKDPGLLINKNQNRMEKA